MDRGHDPREIREYDLRDVEAFLEIEGLLDLRRAIGYVPDD